MDTVTTIIDVLFLIVASFVGLCVVLMIISFPFLFGDETP